MEYEYVKKVAVIFKNDEFAALTEWYHQLEP